jgi:transposase
VEVKYAQCAALDLGKDELLACVRIQGLPHECRTYGTTTSELLKLSEWMSGRGVTHVVMEATGSYWKAVWHILEGSFELILANAAHVKNVPGRKSDVNDGVWLSDLLAHGLIRGSFVPPESIQELRDLTRTRKQLVREVVQHVQRIQKVLDNANLKLTGVVTDIMGVSGRAMLEALIAGEADPERLADLARGQLRLKRARLIEAFRGRITPHHRKLLRLHLDLIHSLEVAIGELDVELETAIEPFRGAVERVKGLPGISDVVAQGVISEIGVDMSRFPSHGHLLSWSCLCPRLDRSAGRTLSNRTRKGAVWLKTLLVQAAWSAVRNRDSYLRSQFLRIRARRGPKKAILAVAASMLTAIYYMLRDGVDYRDLGPRYLDQIDRTRLAGRLVHRLHNLGYEVDLREVA